MGGDRTTGHHFLPQCLLRGFAQERKPKRWQAMCFPIGREPHLIGVHKLGKQSLFYGEPEETRIEEAHGKVENKYGPLLERIRTRRQIPEFDRALLVEMIASLAVRTRHLRLGYATVAEQMIEAISEEVSEGRVLDFVMSALRRDPFAMRQGIASILALLPGAPTDPTFRLGFIRALEDGLRQRTPDTWLPLLRGVTEAIAPALRSIDIHAIAEDGHITGLRQTVVPPSLVTFLSALSWHVSEFTANSVVLSDCGPLGLDPDRETWRPLLVSGQRAQAVALPVAHDLVALGTYDDKTAAIELETLNSASAECSAEFFVAKADKEGFRILSERIGSRAALVDHEELACLVAEATDGAGRNARESSVAQRSSITLATIVSGVDYRQRIERGAADMAQTYEEWFNAIGLLHPVQAELWIVDDLESAVPRAYDKLGVHRTVRFSATRSIGRVVAKLIIGPRKKPVMGICIVDSRLWESDAPWDTGHLWWVVAIQIAGLATAAQKAARDRPDPSVTESTWEGLLKSAALEMLERFDETALTNGLMSRVLKSETTSGHAVPPADFVIDATADVLSDACVRLNGLIAESCERIKVGDEPPEDLFLNIAAAISAIALLLGQLIALLPHSSRAYAVMESLNRIPAFRDAIAPELDTLASAAVDEPDRGTAAAHTAHCLETILARLGFFAESSSDGRVCGYFRTLDEAPSPDERMREGEALARAALGSIGPSA